MSAPGVIVVAMSQLPDPAELRALAARIDAHARAARLRADHLGAAVAALAWTGLAARAFDGEAHVVIVGLRAAADRLDTASAALRRHADRVDQVLAAIPGILRAGLATVEEIVTRPLEVLDALPGGIVSAGGDILSAGGDVVSAGGAVLSNARGAVGDALGFAGL